jgi:hypothetical protein
LRNENQLDPNQIERVDLKVTRWCLN